MQKRDYPGIEIQDADKTGEYRLFCDHAESYAYHLENGGRNNERKFSEGFLKDHR